MMSRGRGKGRSRGPIQQGTRQHDWMPGPWDHNLSPGETTEPPRCPCFAIFNRSWLLGSSVSFKKSTTEGHRPYCHLTGDKQSLFRIIQKVIYLKFLIGT